MENPSVKDTLSVSLNRSINNITEAFMFDEKLQKIMTRPFLVPFGLNTLNTKFIGPVKLGEGDAGKLFQGVDIALS